MLMGGMFVLVLAILAGDLGRADVSRITLRSILSLGYLRLFGSLVNFNAYF